MGVVRDFSPRWGTHPYTMTHPAGFQTPVTCSSLLTRLRKKTLSSASYDEADSGFYTPGSGFPSPETPITGEREAFPSYGRTASRADETTSSVERERFSSCGRNAFLRGETTSAVEREEFSSCGNHSTRGVDFLSRLGAGNYFPVLSKIFAFLSDEDLASASRVCKQWNRAINGNMLVRTRLKAYLSAKISNVENELEIDVRKTNELLSQRPPPEPSSSKGLRLLTNITNKPSQSNLCSQTNRTPRAEVSSHNRFNLFQQEGAKLASDECLSHCPRCNLPARLSKSCPAARCVNKGCEYVFCPSCLCPYVEPTHSCVLVPPTTPRSRRRFYTVGTKVNRANLKRLLR